jgi:hypothetical protein
MAHETITVADYTFQIAHAEITGSLEVAADDGTNLSKASDYGLKWFIEVRAEEYPLTDEDGELITMIEPVFLHQNPTVVVRHWRDWGGQEIVYDMDTSDPSQEAPTFAIGGGDPLPVSTLRIGPREGRRFPFEWFGHCWPGIDERSGLDPFRIVGMITVSTFTVIFNEEDGESEEVATRLLQAHYPMQGLRLRDVRQPYAASKDLPDRMRRLMHATFETDSSV